MKPLFLTESRRVYRPDEAPDDVRDRAVALACEGMTAEDIAEPVFGSLGPKGETYACGIIPDARERGVTILQDRRASPFWNLERGEGVAFTTSDVDAARFVATLPHMMTGPDVARAEELARTWSITFRMRPAPGRWTVGTVAEFYYEPAHEDDDSDAAELARVAEELRDVWKGYVSELCRDALRQLRAQADYLASWETIADRARDMNEGFDDCGRFVSLAECTEGETDAE